MVCESHRLNLREGETFSFGLQKHKCQKMSGSAVHCLAEK